jgi:hypothetical protein
MLFQAYDNFYFRVSVSRLCKGWVLLHSCHVNYLQTLNGKTLHM